MLKLPSLTIEINYTKNEEKERCEKCYSEICEMHNQLALEKRSCMQVTQINNWYEGWYFTIEISLEETELLDQMIMKLKVYGSSK